MRRTLRRVGAAIGDVQLLRVAADGQSMRADPGGNESDLDKALAVDQKNSDAALNLPVVLFKAGHIDDAIAQLEAIDGPTAGLFKVLEKLGLVSDALLAKLDAFRDRIVEGPLVGVLEMGDTILDSLIAAIEILEPLKELKDTIKNKIEYGVDGGIIALNIYPHTERR